MSSRVPNPLIPASQWTDGEPMDELKLHERVDVPLETLGGILRTMNGDLASFYGTLAPGIPSVSANTNISWTAQIDTAGGYVAPFYTPDTSGLYLIAINLGYGTAVAGSCGIVRATATHGPQTDPQAPLSHDGPGVANSGPRITFPIYLNADDSIAVQCTAGFNVSAIGTCWWFVQQLTWG